jgi:peptidoglycan L-alanyl-D-glutamate endopeptidase CwlK
MKDKISEKRIATLHPNIAAEVLLLMNDIEPELPDNVMVRVTYGTRTFAEQDALYQQGRKKPGKIVTKAKPGQSFHNYGLAFDFVLIIDGKASWKVDENWLKVIEHFERNGYEAGHRWKFKDSPHIQKTFGYGWRDLLGKYAISDFLAGSSYVKIAQDTA